MRARDVVGLGIGQCVNWGVLYYAFGVLVLPLEADLAAARWAVTGAFSVALLMSAFCAPVVGTWSDRGHGAAVMQAGGFGAAGLLAVWALFPSMPMLYIAWAGLGLCMAGTLYEPAFALVGRAYQTADARLRALATITIFGGLASTVFLPVTAVLVSHVGWRAAVCVLAFVLAASTFILRRLVFQRFHGARETVIRRDGVDAALSTGRPPRFAFVLVVFSVAGLASAAFTANVVPALTERQIPATTAAALGGFLGVMQLPGRALLMSGLIAGTPARLLALSLILQAAGLGGISLASSLPLTAVGIMVFAVGAGLTALVRPHLVQTLFAAARGGHLNGLVARQQQLARAAGPIGVAWLAGSLGYGRVFLGVAGILAAAAILSYVVFGRVSTLDIERESV